MNRVTTVSQPVQPGKPRSLSSLGILAMLVLLLGQTYLWLRETNSRSTERMVYLVMSGPTPVHEKQSLLDDMLFRLQSKPTQQWLTDRKAKQSLLLARQRLTRITGALHHPGPHATARPFQAFPERHY